MKVYLDMDGVLVNFRKGIHDVFNVSYDYSTLSSKWCFWEDWGIAFKDVNRACTEVFWQNLEWTHDGERIFKYLEERIDPKNMFLLTTPMPNVESWTGKMLWVQRHLPTYEKRLIITTAPKCIFARPNRLLVDDKDKNINEFRQAGGRAIVIARSWNQAKDHAQKTFHKLRYDWGNNKDVKHKRDVRFRLRYGITLKQYDAMFDAQGGCCAICGVHQSEETRRFHLDHEHNTNKIRGILCESCNHLIGQAKDNSNTLINAAIYLENSLKGLKT